MEIKKIVDEIETKRDISYEQLIALLDCQNQSDIQYLFGRARSVADSVYGKDIFIRGLIEFTNYCKNDCFYCGIRKSNCNAKRYRLSKEEILECCNKGNDLGFRTFVLQGGEDSYYSDDIMCEIISEIRRNFKDCAITLSIGEKSYESYKRYFDAGANRYLLRHETADVEHYKKLHPVNLSLENRMNCLRNLKEIGFQVGCGFMVGSPFQTRASLYMDIKFIKEFKPHMVGIGPFITQKDTPFSKYESGTLGDTLKLLSIIRLIHPKVLLPATTALGSIDERGRELGILAGANVVMPNLSPVSVREKYKLYDNKICTGEEAAECRNCLAVRVQSIGYNVVIDKGDYKEYV